MSKKKDFYNNDPISSRWSRHPSKHSMQESELVLTGCPYSVLNSLSFSNVPCAVIPGFWLPEFGDSKRDKIKATTGNVVTLSGDMSFKSFNEYCLTGYHPKLLTPSRDAFLKSVTSYVGDRTTDSLVAIEQEKHCVTKKDRADLRLWCESKPIDAHLSKKQCHLKK
jgi:hypothetical protein